MDLNKVSNLIKRKRKELGITQEELANKLYVTEKAVSRWETGRGTPDISLLIPLSKELNVDVSEILNGEENNKMSYVEKVIRYNELIKSKRFNFYFKLVILSYVLSILIFLIYLRFEYDPSIELNYIIRLLLTIISSGFIKFGNMIYSNCYVEKIDDKRSLTKLTSIIVFIYYLVLLFNMTVYARYNYIGSYNLIPFKSITEIINSGNFYNVFINIAGNLIIFMPLEYFLIKLFNVNHLFMNFIISLTVILAIEIAQFVFNIGVFDIDDIILCTSGMIIFNLIYHKVKKTT